MSRPLFDPSRRTPVPPGGTPAPPGATPASGSRAAAGRLIGGRYVVTDELGRGGMGVVFRARDTALAREVAIKMIGVGDDRATEQQVRRFEREARAAARLRHPAIVPVHEVGTDPTGDGGPGRPFLVMDVIDGVSLESALGREPLAPRRVAEIVEAIARGLHHAHEQGVIHRDVKPENILVERGPGGRAYLTDFGLAREVEGAGAGERLTRSGQIVGTPTYMAPEQATPGRGPVGPLTDVYALGGVLFRALAGRPPFDDEQLLPLMHKVLFVDAPALRSLAPAVHPDLETIAARCLEKDPARRYASAAALADDLLRFRNGELIAARPAGRIERAGRWARRNRLAATALAALGLLALASAAGGVGLWARMRSTLAAERAAVVERAREEATRAQAAFRAARASAADAATERERLDRLLARGLAAVSTAGTLLTLAPDDAAARRAVFEATMDYGEVALAEEQWSLAASAFERALALGVDDARARGLLSQLDVERERVATEHRAAVLGVLEQARSGELGSRPRGREDAVFELVRYPERQTVALLTAALEEITEELRAVIRDRYRDVIEPTDVERNNGGERLEGLSAAVERWLANGHRVRLEPADTALLHRADRRMSLREMRRRDAQVQAGPPSLPLLLATGQEQALGEGKLMLARVCVEALGRIGIADGAAVEAIGAYLLSELDELRAVSAGAALAQLGTERAWELLREGRTRFGLNGPFWRQTVPLYPEATPGDAVSFMEAGVRKLGIDDFEGALADLDAALRANPDNSRALSNRSLARRGLGDRTGALEDISRAIELDPTEAGFYLNRAQVRIDLGDREGARADAERAIELENSPAALLGRAAVLRRLGALAAAMNDYTAALRHDPRSVDALGGRAYCRARLGDVTGALADLSRAVELDPTDAEVYCTRSGLRAQLGQFDAALADASRAIELEPTLVEAWTNRGVVRIERGDLQGGMVDLTRAIELNPLHYNALFARANARRDIRDLEGALEDYGRAIEANPKDPRAYTNRGVTLIRAGRPQQALADVERSLALGDRIGAVWAVRGDAHALLGRPDEALRDYTRSLEIDPRQPTVWNLRAQLLRRLGRLDEAIADHTRALELVPNAGLTLANRALAHQQKGDLDRAVADLDRAVELSPHLAGVWEVRARVHVDRDDLASAERDLTRAIELEPRSAVLWSELAEVSRRNGSTAKARDAIGRALGIEPRHPLALLARARIRRAEGDRTGALADARAALGQLPDGSVESDAARKLIAELEREGGG